MVRINQRSAVNHPAVMTHYNTSDAKLDHPHTPVRELVRLIRPEGRDRRKPLRTQLQSS